VYAVHDAVEVDAHRALVRREVEVLVDAAPGGDACVEEEQVDAAVRLLGLGGGRHHLVVVGDVAVQVRAAELVGDALAVVVVDVEEHDVVTTAGQLAGDLGAETRRAASDVRDLCHQEPSRSSAAMRSRCCAASPYAYSSRLARLK
jgi:hypothetical protein